VNEMDESKSLDRVVADLESRFPGVARHTIEQVVEGEYHQFDGAPVRDYIPVLVAHSAKNSLKKLSKAPRRSWAA
jgi:hypothetical protein